MRLLPLLVALLMLSFPLAGAQQGDACDDSPCDDPDRDDPDDGTPDGRDAQHCDDANATRNRSACGPSDNPRNPGGPAAAYCREHPGDERCRAAQERFRDDAQDEESMARHVAFEVDAANRTLSEYRIDGRLVFDAIVLDDHGATNISRDGRILVLRSNESVLRLHDAPTGNVEFKSRGHNLTLDLPGGTQTGRHGETDRGHFLEIRYSGGFVGKLAADRIDIHGDDLRLSGFASFHLDPVRPQEPPTPERRERDEAFEEAEESRHLGARVTIKRASIAADNANDAVGAAPGADGAGSGAAGVEITQYDDLQIVVDAPAHLGRGDSLEVTVSAELAEGRTVVLDLDPALLNGLSVSAESALDLKYYDVNDDGTRTRVFFEPADGGLRDVLDPTDDAGQPEYWIVQDADGLQVIVSFPHWSTHVVTIENVLEFVTQPSVIVGLIAGIGGVAVAAATMLMPRRREEELY